MYKIYTKTNLFRDFATKLGGDTEAKFSLPAGFLGEDFTLTDYVNDQRIIRSGPYLELITWLFPGSHTSSQDTTRCVCTLFIHLFLNTN